MKTSFILLIFFSPHVKSRDITRILKSCDISAVYVYMCFAYEISCFDLSKNICIEHIIYLILKNFKYIYFFLFLI